MVSISKWESKWKIPFLPALENKTLTDRQWLSYIKCMTITQKVNPKVYNNLTMANLKEIIDYINDPMTASTVKLPPNPNGQKEIVTSELIYCWMCQFGVPPEYQKWHFNRLSMLLRICAAKNAPEKKMSAKETVAYYKELNDQRRKKYNSRG